MGKLGRLISNVFSMLTSDVLNRVTTFVLYALVARYLGTFEFGQLSLALLLFYTFQVFAALGIRMLLAREVARNPERTEQYLVNGSVTVFLAALLSILVLLIFTWIMGYSLDTATVIMMMSLGIIPYALANVCEGIFQARERMSFIAYANGPANIFKVITAVIILEQGFGVYMLTIALVLTHLFILLIEWYFLVRYIVRPRLQIDFSFCSTILKQVIPFLGIDSVAAIWASLNILLLSKMTGETEVGLYNAANQVLVPAYLVLRSLTISVYPIMCRKFDTGLHDLKRVYEYLLEMVLAVTVPAAVGIFFLAEPILLLFYGDEGFLQAATVLRIVAWVLIPLSFTTTFGHTLQASLNERINLRIVIVNTIISLILGIILIYPFGIIGAAIALVASRVVDMIQHYIPVTRLFSQVVLGKVIWKSALASLCMALYLALLAQVFVSELPWLWLIIPTAAAVYAVGLLAVMVLSDGGIQHFKARYIRMWTD